jgi:hypothetical protein
VQIRVLQRLRRRGNLRPCGAHAGSVRYFFAHVVLYISFEYILRSMKIKASNED